MPSPKRRAKARHDAIALTAEEELEARLAGDIPPALAAVDEALGTMHRSIVAQAILVAHRSTDDYFTDQGKAAQWADAVNLIERARLFRRAA
jgi:hypothetical protein